MYACPTPFQNKATQAANEDVQAQRREYVFTFSLVTRITGSGLVRDKRDVPLVLLLINVLATTVPAAVMLHACKVESHLLGLLYLVVNYALYLQVRHMNTGGQLDGLAQHSSSLKQMCMLTRMRVASTNACIICCCCVTCRGSC